MSGFRWWALAVCALAVYRAARFVTRDTLTDNVRARLYDWAWDDEHPVANELGGVLEPSPRANWRTYVYELLTCQWCISVWFAAGAYVTWRWWENDVTRGVLYVLAISAVAGFVGSRSDA